MDRRKFLKNSAMGTAALSASSFANPFQILKKTGPGDMFIGTPVLPVYLYERGIPSELDRMKEVAGINTVMTFSHTHVFRQYRAGFTPLTDEKGREITDVFVKTNPEYYPEPGLQGKNPAALYADRDILDELVEAAEPRDMKIYARILEPYVITGAIPGLEDFAEINAHGEKGRNVCFNHPGYIAYWEAVANDLILSHPKIAGFKFGQERGGPMFASLGGGVATCFCEHCVALGKQRSVNPEKARKGMLALRNYAGEVKESGEAPTDGYFVSFMRILAQYPDILSWEKLFMDSRENQRKRFYTQMKGLREELQVGWHMDHGMTWDLITRTFDDYQSKGPYSDWLSVAVYFDSMGRRSYGHYNKFYRNLLFGDATENISYPMYLSMLGYDPEKEPELEAHSREDTEFSSDYVYRECKRAVTAVNGKALVYARPGFDMPGYDCDIRPEQVYDVVHKCLDAGVDGLWCGREWDELKPENAEAFGKAVREYNPN